MTCPTNKLIRVKKSPSRRPISWIKTSLVLQTRISKSLKTVQMSSMTCLTSAIFVRQAHFLSALHNRYTFGSSRLNAKPCTFDRKVHPSVMFWDNFASSGVTRVSSTRDNGPLRAPPHTPPRSYSRDPL